MYQVSNEYKAKMLDQVQTHRLRGVLNGNIAFTDADVVGVSWKNQCSGKNVNIGSVNIGTLKLTFLTDLLNRGDYYGKTITLSDGLLIDPEHNIWEDIPIGTFYIAEAVWSGAGMVNITAYDCLSKMDTTLSVTQSAGTVYAWCNYIATQTHTIFGMTEEDVAYLPNGTEVISVYEENNLETWRDLLSALTQFIGGFAYAAKDGTWKIKPFGNTTVLNVPKNRRMSGARFSDFQTLYDAIQYTDLTTGMVYVIGDNNGLVMNIGSNPFMQYGSSDAKERRATRIANSIKRMRYIPFDVSMLPAFIALDLGDVVTFTDDYTEDTSFGAVMSVVWTYNKTFKVTCYGDNPNLRSGQSQSDRNIAGLMRSTQQNEVTYYTYANIESLTFGSEIETTIARLRFSPAQKTTVKIMHEFIMDMVANLSTDCSYELHYYLDDELVAYSPYERVQGIYGASSGATNLSLCRDFFYILRDVEAGSFHTWEVKMITHGVTSTTIDVDHAHVILEGQRLYSEEFYGGLIEARDTLTVYPFGYLSFVSFSESASVTLFTSLNPTASDSVPVYDIATIVPVTIAEGTGEDAPQIRLRGGHFIDTEILERLTTEDGARLITE